eukprot:CRZ01784.1 hypothetical protein [Spongospora subterranea]
MIHASIQSKRCHSIEDLVEHNQYRCRVRLQQLQHLSLGSRIVLMQISDADDNTCSISAFLHRKFSLNRWVPQQTILRMASVRLAGSRLLPTEHIVEEIKISNIMDVRESERVFIGRLIRRSDGSSSASHYRRGQCLTLQGFYPRCVIQWFQWGPAANLGQLLQLSEIVVVHNAEFIPKTLGGEEAGDAAELSQRVESLDGTIVQVVVDDEQTIATYTRMMVGNDEPSFTASPIDEGLSQLSTSVSEAESDLNTWDATDLESQRMRIDQILEYQTSLINVSLFATIVQVDRQQSRCSVTDESHSLLDIALDFNQSQTWLSGQTIFAYRLRSAHSRRRLFRATDPKNLHNIAYSAGILASPSLYCLSTLYGHPHFDSSTFICQAPILQIELPTNFCYDWCSVVTVLIDDGTALFGVGTSPIALEGILTCPLATFASVDPSIRQDLMQKSLRRPLLLMITVLCSKTHRLRVEQIREI